MISKKILQVLARSCKILPRSCDDYFLTRSCPDLTGSSKILARCSTWVSKLENIVAETFYFLSMFTRLPTSVNIVAETKLIFREAKMFPNKFRNIFVAETMFPSLPKTGNMTKHQQETMFSRQRSLVSRGLHTRKTHKTTCCHKLAADF